MPSSNLVKSEPLASLPDHRGPLLHELMFTILARACETDNLSSSAMRKHLFGIGICFWFASKTPVSPEDKL
jgi:hypothetical protein